MIFSFTAYIGIFQGLLAADRADPMGDNGKPHLLQFQGKFGVFAFLGAHVFSTIGTFDFIDHLLSP
jgi:hypothetical protein